MNLLSNSLLNILDLDSSDLFDEVLHFGLADLSVVVFIDGTKNSVELLLWESVCLIDLSEVSNHKASHLSLGELT